MQQHALSQIDEEEATRLLLARLRDPHTEALRTRAIGTREVLSLWRIETPERPMWMIRLADVIDNEPLHEFPYGDEGDALAVWEHLIEEYESPSD